MEWCGVLADEFYDLFNQLFYSEEIWGYLGLTLLIGFLFVVGYKIKAFNFVSFLILALMGLHYFSLQLAGGYYIWHGLIALAACFLTVVIFLQKGTNQ